MQLEAAPVEVEIEFPQQPDQTASLSDVAERSDEVGVEAKFHELGRVQITRPRAVPAHGKVDAASRKEAGKRRTGAKRLPPAIKSN